MDSYLSQKDRIFLLCVAAGLVAAGTAGFFFFRSLMVSVLVITASVFLAMFQLQLFRRFLVQLKQQTDRGLQMQMVNYRQLEAFLSLVLPLRPEALLPSFRDWAASPDFLLEAIREIERLEPEVVLETGSGTSTVITGLYLKKAGRGRLISLEHSPEYYRKTMGMLKSHDLLDTVDLVLAPLNEVIVDGKVWKWYDITSVILPETIDMIIVDGPPEHVQKDARFPAVPVLRKWMRKGTVILVDDGAREGERNAVKCWQDLIPGLNAEFLPLEKGAYRLCCDVRHP